MREVGSPSFHNIRTSYGILEAIVQTFELDEYVDLEETSFVVQELPDSIATYCPVCEAKAIIYIMSRAYDGCNRLCHYCADCNLPFVSVVTHKVKHYGEVEEPDEFWSQF